MTNKRRWIAKIIEKLSCIHEKIKKKLIKIKKHFYDNHMKKKNLYIMIK